MQIENVLLLWNEAPLLLDGLILPAYFSASPNLTIRPRMCLNDSAKEDEYNSWFVLVMFLIH